MARVRKTTEAVFQPRAECLVSECGWYEHTGPSAKARAMRHVKATGHGVRLVVERVSVWRRDDD